MNAIKGFLASLLSRKLLTSLGGAAAALAAKQYYVAGALVAVYVASEAHVDAKGAAAKVEALLPEAKAIIAAVDPALTPLAATVAADVTQAADAVIAAPVPADVPAPTITASPAVVIGYATINGEQVPVTAPVSAS